MSLIEVFALFVCAFGISLSNLWWIMTTSVEKYEGSYARTVIIDVWDVIGMANLSCAWLLIFWVLTRAI